MPTYLLDSNILIAFAIDTHADHRRCVEWITSHSAFATCPITEGSLTRFVLRNNHPIADSQATLQTLAALPNWAFWPDDLSYADANLGSIHGHHQVTDAYLAALARVHGAKLATMDVGLAVTHPDVTTLIP